MKNFSMILSVDEKNWISKNSEICWNLKWDLKKLKEITTKNNDLSKYNAVIMWRKTWEKIPSKFRPLSERINCILSKKLKIEDIDSKIDDFVLYFNNFDHCLEELSKRENVENIFLIWWWSLYNQFIKHKNLEKIFLTRILKDFSCDTFFSWMDKSFVLESESEIFEENWIKYKFEVYKKI
jgi:dihydrofolate reductase